MKNKVVIIDTSIMCEVIILTGDKGLMIHQNVDIKGTNVPRRRR